MSSEKWLNQAAGYFKSDAISKNTFFDVETAFKGYDVVYEQAGIGLVINQKRTESSDNNIWVGIMILWNSRQTDVVEEFCMVLRKKQKLSEWKDTAEIWFSIASRLAELRIRGYKICNTQTLRNENVRYYSASVSHPLSHAEFLRIPYLATPTFQSTKTYLLKYLDSLQKIEDNVEYENRNEYDEILEQALLLGKQFFQESQNRLR